MKRSFKDVLMNQNNITESECNQLWELEETKVHQDVSDELMSQIAEYISNVLDLNQDDNLLTIGCGDGVLDKFIIPKVNSFYGIDFSQQKLSVAQERNPNGVYYKRNFMTDYSKLFQDKNINKIYSYSVMQYCKPDFEHVKTFIENQKKSITNIKQAVIAHFDVPDVNKAYFYYKDICSDVTEDLILDNIEKLRVYMMDGSYWHNGKTIASVLKMVEGIRDVKVKDARYWRNRSDVIIRL